MRVEPSSPARALSTSRVASRASSIRSTSRIKGRCRPSKVSHVESAADRATGRVASRSSPRLPSCGRPLSRVSTISGGRSAVSSSRAGAGGGPSPSAPREPTPIQEANIRRIGSAARSTSQCPQLVRSRRGVSRRRSPLRIWSADSRTRRVRPIPAGPRSQRARPPLRCTSFQASPMRASSRARPTNGSPTVSEGSVRRGGKCGCCMNEIHQAEARRSEARTRTSAAVGRSAGSRARRSASSASVKALAAGQTSEATRERARARVSSRSLSRGSAAGAPWWGRKGWRAVASWNRIKPSANMSAAGAPRPSRGSRPRSRGRSRSRARACRSARCPA